MHSAGMRSQNCTNPKGGGVLPYTRMKADAPGPGTGLEGSAAAACPMTLCVSRMARKINGFMTPLLQRYGNVRPIGAASLQVSQGPDALLLATVRLRTPTRSPPRGDVPPEP